MLKVNCRGVLKGYRLPRKLVDLFCKPSLRSFARFAILSGVSTGATSFPIPRNRELKRQTVSYSRSLFFGAAMAERDSERTGLLSEGTRRTLERSRDGFDGRFVS